MIQAQLTALLTPIAPTFAQQAPQGTKGDYITYFRVAMNPGTVLKANGNPAIINTRFQVDAWSMTYIGSQNIARAIQAAMESWSVQNTEVLEQDLYEDAVMRYRVQMDFSVWHH